MATKKSAEQVDTTITPVEPETLAAESTPEAAPEAAASPAVVPEAGAPGDDAADQPVQQVVVVDAPIPPRNKGNRGLGTLFAFAATIVYTALFAIAVFLIGILSGGAQSFAFLSEPTFYFAPLFFFIGSVLVILVLNRAGWWSHIIGSVVVAVVVYFGTAGALLLAAGVFQMTRGEANDVYFAGLANPITIAAALIAREVAIWLGAILARRGRVLKVHNAQAREAFEREQAELIPTV